MSIQFWDVQASGFTKTMRTGRTIPTVFVCDGRRCTVTDGIVSPSPQVAQDDFVIKFNGVGEMTPRASLCELAGAFLAQALRTPVVEPALVTVPLEMAPVIPPPKRACLSADNTKHFGSRYSGAGWVTYSAGKALELDLLDAAFRVFFFDMLIHNADRCVRNPNVLTNGAELKTYDHELAFPFLLPILGEKTEPWKIKHMEWATQHVFFRGLKGKNLDITGCTDRLLQLDSGIMNSVAAVAPSNWVTSDLDKIWQHIEAVKLNAGLFADEVSGVLA